MGIRDHAVHYDSPTSRKADWHSFRRAFATALAEAGANEQTARNLVAQGDASVHARHVQQMRAMQHIPEAAVPLFGAFAPPQKVTAVTNDQTGKSRSPEKEARPVRFELTTSGFEGRRSIQLSYGRVGEVRRSTPRGRGEQPSARPVQRFAREARARRERQTEVLLQHLQKLGR